MSTQDRLPAFIGKAAVIHQTTRPTTKDFKDIEGKKAIQDALKKAKAMKEKDEDANNMAVMLIFVQVLIKCMSPEGNPDRGFLYREMDSIEAQMKLHPQNRKQKWLKEMCGHPHQTAMACLDRI